MQNDSALRAIATRLTVTAVEDLPRIAGFLASSLSQCSLEVHFSDSKTSGGASVAAHKLRTRVTSLLQDRSTAGRLTAAVLIKAIIDNGGSNVLSTSDVWARGLLTCLNKPDPSHVKKIYLSTVTRIFLLTQSHSTLLREVTTPLLPAYITACLGLIRPIRVQVGGHATEAASLLLDPVLECWIQLLPQHATVFRPFLTRMKLLGQSLLENGGTSTSTRELTSRLMCMLISCAPKNTGSQEWTQMANGIIDSAHQTSDQLFRAVLEDYEPNDTSKQRAAGKHNFSKDPRVSGKDHLGLGPWLGIQEGGTRLVTLIEWLGNLISTSTSHHVQLPVGAILDLSSRIMAITPPQSKTSTFHTPRYHNEAGREEKEQLWLNLSHIHTSCLRLLNKLTTIYGQSLSATNGAMLDQILDNFEVMSGHETVRLAVYALFQGILGNIDFTHQKLSQTAFSVLVEQCSNDLKTCLPVAKDVAKLENSKDGFLSVKSISTASKHSVKRPSKAFQAAWDLLPAIITHCPSSMITRQSRIEMDRLSVLLDHRDAMLASIMRPMISDKGKATTASLLPFLARSSADSITIEALLRPRMPVVQVGADLVPKSQDEELTTQNEHHEEEEEDLDDNILSQSEHSNDATEETVKNTVPTSIGTNSPAEEDGSEEQLTVVNKKRPRNDIEHNEEDSPSANTQHWAPREPKMPRLGDGADDSANLWPNHAITTRGNGPRNSTSLGVVNTVSQKREVLPQATAVNAAAGNEGSDSDDSEIPQIDPTLTDEEDSE